MEHTAAAAAAILVLAILRLPLPDADPQITENQPPAETISTEIALSNGEFATTENLTADELTLALEAATARQYALFYGRALALEDLLADAAELSEQENEEALDFLTILAEN